MPGLRVGVADLRDRIRAALIEKVKIACIAFVAFIGVIFFNGYLTFAWGQTCSGAVVVSVYGNLGSLSPYFRACRETLFKPAVAFQATPRTD